MIFGNFINKLLLCRNHQVNRTKCSRIKTLHLHWLLLFPLLSNLSLLLLQCLLWELHCKQKDTIPAIFFAKLEQIQLLNCFFISATDISTPLLFHIIRSNRPERIHSQAYRRQFETSCGFSCFILRSLLLLRIFSLRMAFRQTFQNSIGNVNFWRARHFQ